MKKMIVIGIIVVLLLSGFTIAATFNDNLELLIINSNGNTLYVGGSKPGNYSNIQDAIDNTSDGDTVYVFNGTYDENIELNKRLSFIGEYKNTTIINGKQEGCTINLSSENVIIENFTIIGGGFDTDDFTNFFRAGIRITGSNNIICNNIFKKIVSEYPVLELQIS